MKFRDPNTGEVFQNITGAFVNFCAGRNCKSKLSGYVCPFREKSISTPGCSTWAINHPTEAARLMGYEVIEDEKEANMEKKDKPRLAEVLGVDIGERFAFRDGDKELPGLYVDSDGYIWGNGYCVSNFVLCSLINRPESIIRAPRLTEGERRICKDVGAKWVSRGALGTKSVVLWDAKPECFDDGTFGSTDTAHKLARMYTGFENVHPGDCICVEEAGVG